MALSCETHSAHVYDRGGKQLIAVLDGIVRVQWSRERDATSTASVTVSQRASSECHAAIGQISTGRHELVIYRGKIRVWEGPITHLEYRKTQATVSARDVTHYLNRMIMKGEYDNTYPNIGYVVKRMERIILAESVRFEAQNPPMNIRQYVTAHHRPDVTMPDGTTRRIDAGTSTHTLRYHSLVFEHLEQLSQRGGLDYTAIGRSIHLWDVRNPALGQTSVLTEDDFLGESIITEYGMDLCTVAAMTDGKGRFAQIGTADPYYGLVEMVETAYDEDTGDDWQDRNNEPPTIAELRSQAQRMLRNPPPLVVRVPENSSVNPNGTLSINELIPGIWVPLQASLPGRTVSQMQKLDSLTVTEEAGSAENIQITLSPAPNPKEDVPFE